MGEGSKSGPTFNGGYYSGGGGGGGTIPSPAAAHKLSRPRHNSCCGLCCLPRLLLKLVVTFIIIVGIAVLVFWLVVRPTKPKFYVDSVQFNNVTNTTTSNLVLGISVRNANKKMGIYYDTFIVSAYEEGNSIALTTLGEFYQGHKNTTTLTPVFTSMESQYLSSDSEGVAEMEVKLRTRVRFKVWKVKTRRYKLKVNCGLSIPVNEATANTFTRKKCKVELDR